MANITINGKVYDLDRCSREQLQKLSEDYLFQNNGTQLTSGESVLTTARVETKHDVAGEIVQYCTEEFGPEGLGFGASALRVDPLRTLIARYRKAVDS